MATEQDQPDHRQDADHPRHAGATGRARCDAAQRRADLPAHRHGRPFKSAAAFGNKFADWCNAAGLEPVLCDDGKTRNYRAHGLRKAALTQLAHNGCTAPEIISVSGHATLAEVQKYIVAVEQERMAKAAMAKRAAGSNQAQGSV